MSRSFARLRLLMLAGVLMAGTLPAGCGSSGQGVTRGTPNGASLLTEDDEYKYVGKGKARHKVALTRQERMRKIRERERASNAVR